MQTRVIVCAFSFHCKSAENKHSSKFDNFCGCLFLKNIFYRVGKICKEFQDFSALLLYMSGDFYIFKTQAVQNFAGLKFDRRSYGNVTGYSKKFR